MEERGHLEDLFDQLMEMDGVTAQAGESILNIFKGYGVVDIDSAKELQNFRLGNEERKRLVLGLLERFETLSGKKNTSH